MGSGERIGFWQSLPDKLVLPLVLAGAGAALTFFFGPYLTNRWQDHQHNFATKTALVNELSNASAQLMSAVQTREFRPSAETPALYLAAFRTWDTESQTIDAKIATYFAYGQQLAAEWREFVEEMRLYHNLPDNAGKTRQNTVHKLAAYANTPSAESELGRQPPDATSNVVYQSAWVMLKYALIARRDQFVARLNRERIAN